VFLQPRFTKEHALEFLVGRGNIAVLFLPFITEARSSPLTGGNILRHLRITRSSINLIVKSLTLSPLANARPLDRNTANSDWGLPILISIRFSGIHFFVNWIGGSSPGISNTDIISLRLACLSFVPIDHRERFSGFRKLFEKKRKEKNL
jgi:hypothetical protein